MRTKSFSIILTVILLLSQTCVFSAPAQKARVSNSTIATGNKLTQAAHNAYEKRDYLGAGEGYEKAYKLTGYKLYLENAVIAYTSYAYDLTNQKDYNKAVEYCKKVLSLNPKDNNAKELIADVYYAKGSDYFYTGDIQKAKAEFDSSLKYSTNKDQTDKAKEALDRIAQVESKGGTPYPKYENTTDIDIPAAITAVENKLYGSASESASIIARINKLEKDALGKTYDNDSIIIRTDRLKRTVIPEYISQKPSDGYSYSSSSPNSENYISDIIDQSRGQVTIFGKMPISVFIDDASVKPYKKTYKKAILEAMKEWEKASDNKIKFQEIYEPAKSDIKIVWTENFEDFPWQPVLKKEDISAEKERMKYRKASMAVQIGSVAAALAGGLIGVPVLGGVAGVGSSFASPYLQYKGTRIERLSPDVKICVNPTEGLAEDQANLKIKQIAIHQLGHAIGIYGHSPNPNDIMYSNFTTTELSQRDISTIKEIYKNKEQVIHE